MICIQLSQICLDCICIEFSWTKLLYSIFNHILTSQIYAVNYLQLSLRLSSVLKATDFSCRSSSNLASCSISTSPKPSITVMYALFNGYVYHNGIKRRLLSVSRIRYGSYLLHKKETRMQSARGAFVREVACPGQTSQSRLPSSKPNPSHYSVGNCNKITGLVAFKTRN